MFKKAIIFFIFCSVKYFSFAQNEKFIGVVYDNASKTPIAFASVVLKETKLGVVTDIDGKFTFAKVPENFTLEISSVGYKTKQVETNNAIQPFKIGLELENKILETVTISNAENPAHRIIKLLIKNKNNNNPELYKSFKYNAYTISTLSIGDFSSFAPKEKPVKKPKKPLTASEAREDSMIFAFVKKVKRNHLFVTESYIERKFKFPNKSIEIVLATKVSGLQQPQFAFTPSSFQPFGFYKEYLEMGTDKYLSPIANSSISFYNFRLKETIENTNDTTFIISFAPKKNKNFSGLKGLLYINSDGYVIENVLASQAQEKGVAFRFKIQQQYKKINDKWFPHQFNTVVNQATLDSGVNLLNWDSRSYIKNITIGEDFPKSNFSDITQVFDKNASKQKDTAWQKWRADTLSIKETNTYKIYDSLPKNTLSKINKLSKLISLVALKGIPFGKIDIPFKYLGNTNKYEGFRLGVGMQTIALFSKYFSVGAFVGYGIKDKAVKYGGNLFFTLKDRTAIKLSFSYQKNLVEPGISEFFATNNNISFTQNTRNIFTSRMDSIEQYKINFSTKLATAIEVNFWLQNEKRNPALYDYLFEDKNTTILTRNFITSEIGLGLRYARGESFMKIGNAKIQNKLATTQILFELRKGIKAMWQGDFDYTKTAIQINHILNSKWLGQTLVQINATKIIGDLPYVFLANTKASKPEKNSNIYIPNTFQTVGLYEFASTENVTLFIQQDFGSLLFKPKNVLIRPTFLFIQNIEFGTLSNISSHKNISFKTATKGLFESGIMVKNIYRKKVSNLFYAGLGAGVFYRYGYYKLPKAADNWSLKFGLNFSLN